MPTALLLGHLLVSIEAVPTPVHLRVTRVEMRCLEQLGPLLGAAGLDLAALLLLLGGSVQGCYHVHGGAFRALGKRLVFELLLQVRGRWKRVQAVLEQRRVHELEHCHRAGDCGVAGHGHVTLPET